MNLWEFPIEDFLVLAWPDAPGLYILNPSARSIWEAFKSDTPLAELVQEFASTYNIPSALAEQDVTQTINEWLTGMLARHFSSFPSPSTPTDPPAASSSDFFARD